MDQVRDITHIQELIESIHQAEEFLSPDFLLIILGPTASGKTKLAVKLAQAMNGEIISADSRQVYRQLDIGTGKDLIEYQDIPYHLIDIVDPHEHYNVDLFREAFQQAFVEIRSRKKLPILCGGTGSYIQSLLQEQPYSQIPKDKDLQNELSLLPKETLIARIKDYSIPEDFNIDWNSHKRLVRALEILIYLKDHPKPEVEVNTVKDFLILGLSPDRETRRARIDQRLETRMEEGLLAEVEGLLAQGISHEQMQWFGLEYKYASLHLQGELTMEEFKEKLRTEIHRFAKRQMTYFRKMEKDGLKIHWIDLL
ncbi:tRNA (adenosine(37)-N6)-dimethylallyltransferase MiaA [Sphingobacterium mizutaii]|uniref:tRNA (adenosine(37)-N6)-dimethylallyltransferase MiaA n=1 Tax=Sphingobacterium mizutaii TaxID=1010 RepID=UPI0016246EEF|nr:tRNA (adenosine(37)-N6)-dimethylallyltransferase MiaA [Sphingobacterium mizutaii]